MINIDQINRKHYSTKDIYYRVVHGLASKLLKYENETIYIELEIRNKWTASYNDAVTEIAKCWKSSNEDLHRAKYCNIVIIDSKRFPYKRTLLHLGVKPGYDMRKGISFS